MTHMQLTSVAVLSFLLTATTARADAIDGNWCRSDGKRMSIRGSEIVTPGGSKTLGDYSRHFFSYVVPSGEPGAGNKVAISLQNEYLAHAREGNDPAIQEWRRCHADVS